MKIALDPTPFHHDYELLDFPRVVGELGYEYVQVTPHRDFIPFFNHPRADDEVEPNPHILWSAVVLWFVIFCVNFRCWT